MATKFYSAFICSISVIAISCGTPVTPPNNDTMVVKNAKHGITVSDPGDHQPHQVKDSIYNGEHIERYDNGIVYMRGEVKGGLREGEWLTFYRDGKLWSVGTYKDGLREGYGVSFYPNGDTSSVGHYKSDKMIGHWKFWDEYGNKKETTFGEK